MQISILSEVELPKLAAIDQDVNLTPWSYADFYASYKDINHLIWGICAPNLIGGCVISRVLDEAEILQLCIATEYQGQGCARKLLSFIINILRQQRIASMFLEVRKDNQAAINLYHACGFNQISLRKNYYKLASGRMDALVMALQL